MNLFADTWRQLVRRRLWPVAALLLAGLVAVPFVLAKDPEPVAAPPPRAAEETTAAEAAATGDPVVALAEEGDRSRRRRVLGARKDPFAPAPVPKARKSDDPPQTGDQPTLPEPELPPVDSGGGVPTDPGGYDFPPVEPPAVPTEKKKTYPPDSLIVRFGDAEGGELQRQTVEKLAGLPSETEADTQPVLVYTGLSKDGKSATFLVDALAEATGDGECKPHPSNCETIHLRKGETEFFDVKDPVTGDVVAQYQLDLVDINHKKASAASARKAHKAVARVSGKSEAGL
jgi:hypothetical protein